MKNFLTTLWIIFASVFSTNAQDLIQNIAARNVTSLNGRWNYIIDPYEMGYYDYRHMPFDESETGKGGFYDNKKPNDKNDWVEYDFDLSPTLKIPGDWNSQVEKLELYEGTIWMRQKFSVNPKTDKKYVLYFGAVNYESQVYLNGKKLGHHKGGFTPFQFDVTGKLTDGENVVTVKVDNKRFQDEIPTINTDWWNYGGITRDVLLAELPVTHIQDYKVQLAKGSLNRVEGFIQIAGISKIQNVTITIPEADIKQTVKTDSAGRAELNFPIKNITYWSPENPKLYAVEIQSTTDKVTDKIGFRTIETRG